MFHFSSRLLLSACLASTMLLPACKGKEQRQSKTETTTTISVADSVKEGLDLSELPALVKEARNGEELEEIINNSGINNLDLNNDQFVDFINVEEFRKGDSRGFALYTNENDQRFDVAEVLVNKSQSTGDVVVQGNPEYYGSSNRYYSSFPLGQILFAAWLFDIGRPRYYHRAYYRGYYPSYYRSSSRLSRSMYRNKLSSRSYSIRGKSYKPSTTSQAYKSTSTSRFGAAKSSSSQKSLANTKGTSFQKTTNKRPAGSATNSTSKSGFGTSSNRKTTSTTKKPVRSSTTKTPVRSKTSSSSKSGFGSSSSRNRSSSSSRRSSSSSRGRRR